MRSNKVSNKIYIGIDDMLFIENYKKEKGVTIQAFIEDAVKKKIQDLRVEEFINKKKI